MSQDKEFRAIVAIVVVLVVGTCLVSVVYQYGTRASVVFTVQEKERITTKESGYYLVYTSGETFKNDDALWHGKFSSSDLHGRLNVGETYQAQVYGWRLPFFSVYRNIISVQSAD